MKQDEITLYIECTGEEKFNRNNALRCHIKKNSLPAVVVANDCWAETSVSNLKCHTLKLLTQFSIVDWNNWFSLSIHDEWSKTISFALKHN